MAAPPRFPTLSPAAKYSSPHGDQNASLSTQEFATAYRWSNTNVESSPAVIVQPATENDIFLLIEHAKSNGLEILPVSGGHGSFAPVDCKTLYLDMRLFDSLTLDEVKGEVTISGGVLAGQVLDFLAKKGWYTTVPNANAVGMVGFVLGGGSSGFNALHGMAVDNVVGVRVVGADGRARTLGEGDQGEEARLWDVLRGAGYGFVVVTSLTLKAWRISSLGLDDDRIWTRRLIFPPSAAGVDAAARLFTALQIPPRRLSTVLFFARAPPTASTPGAPMLMLLLSYLGPAAEAEKAAALSFESAYTSHALLAETGAVSLARMNDAAAPMSRHGGFKENYSVWSHAFSPSQIIEAFESWLSLGERVPDAKAGSYVVLACKNPVGMLEQDAEGRTSFPREVRGREVFVQVVPWWSQEGTEGEARKWAGGMLERLFVGEGVRGFAANLYKGVEVGGVWPEAKVREIRRVKEVWDSEGVFWCPVVDGIYRRTSAQPRA